MFLLRQEIPLKSIQYIIENTEDKRMCVYYTVRAADQTDTVGYTFLPINIHRQKNDAFVKALRKMNTAIEYRSFTKDDLDDPSEYTAGSRRFIEEQGSVDTGRRFP
jgi:hypothetical protein